MAASLDFSRITDQIYVGEQPSASDWYVLGALDITVDINLQSEAQDQFYMANAPEVYLWLRTPDYAGPDVSTLLTAVLFIRRMLQENRNVYIHCRLGIGRSPVVAAAYLVTTGLNHQQALKAVQKARPVTSPLPAQIGHLREFAELWQQSYA